jgi:lysophospholipase L1-like esterase
MPFRVAIVGDSAMWGQGLLREHTYASLAASRLAQSTGDAPEIVAGPPNKLDRERGEPRSGAKIRAHRKNGTDVVLLPSDNTTPAEKGDRANFARTHRSLFSTDPEMVAFLDGRDETPASALFGEHPATFPTVMDQVRDAGTRANAPVDLVLLNGGANDVDFETVLDPEGPDLAKLDRAIEDAFGDDLRTLLRRTRRTFPSALIVVTGYFSVLSKSSSRRSLKKMFLYMADKPEWQIALNAGINHIPGLRDITNGLGLTKDVDGLIETAIRRSIIAAAHAHFWALRGLADLPADVRGPGIVFAFPAFRAQHALFAGSGSLVYQGYRLRGETSDARIVVSDEMRDRRRANIPRLDLLDAYKSLRALVIVALLPGGGMSQGIESRLRALLTRNDLPSQLLEAGRAVLTAGTTSSELVDLAEALGDEIGRIEIALIASALHPNPAGARRYADRITESVARHRRFSIRVALERMAGRDGVARLSSLRQHGIATRTGVRQIRPIAFIESVAVALTGMPGTGASILSVPATLQLGANVKFDMRIPIGMPTVFRAFDPEAELRLADITEIVIEGSPRFDELTLFLNGRTFFRGRRVDGIVNGMAVRFRVAK